MDPSTMMSSSIEDDFNYGTNVKQATVGVRLGFLRKVYCILIAQLAVTTVVCALFLSIDSVKKFVQNSHGMLVVGMILSLVLVFALMVKRKEHPTNIYLLAAFTLVESYTVGTVVTFYKVEIVLQAFILTLSVFGILTTYTLQSKKDYSSWGAALFVGLWVLIGAGFLQVRCFYWATAVFPKRHTVELMTASAGALLFCLFFIYDTHMLMVRLSPEEYILASINLYLDVINLFLETLRILSKMNNK